MNDETVDEWRAFIATVNVRGPIPITFEIVRWPRENGAPSRGVVDEWILRWTMQVPDRETGDFSPVTFHSKLPEARTDAIRRVLIRQCVLGAFQHEALESIFIDGERVFDPHAQRWYSNLVADWRFVP